MLLEFMISIFETRQELGIYPKKILFNDTNPFLVPYSVGEDKIFLDIGTDKVGMRAFPPREVEVPGVSCLDLDESPLRLFGIARIFSVHKGWGGKKGTQSAQVPDKPPRSMSKVKNLSPHIFTISDISIYEIYLHMFLLRSSKDVLKVRLYLFLKRPIASMSGLSSRSVEFSFEKQSGSIDILSLSL